MSDVERKVSPGYSDEKHATVSIHNESGDEDGSFNGAPVEADSPLGRQVGRLSVIALNVSMMIGTGIFVTPGSILKSLGSPGASLMVWLIGVAVSFAGLAVYNEFAAWFPRRSGSEVVYLEQAYPRPKLLFPITFAVITVLLSFSASNSLVFAQYILTAADSPVTKWKQRGIAVACIGAVSLMVMASTKWSLRITNLLAAVKVILLVFIVITGFVVLGGHTRVPDPHANFRNAFEGTSNNGNAWSSALIKVIFAFGGYNNANNLVNEIPNPVRTLKLYSNIALAVVSILYVMAAVAFFAAVPKEEIRESSLLTAALFFQKVFGDHAAARVLPAFVAISAFGNILAVSVGHTRVIREVARQGVLPFAKFWTSTKPFASPAGPVLITFTLSTIVIIAPPAKDVFPFLVDLQSYPDRVFALAMTLGLYRVRRQYRGQTPIYKAWDVAIIFTALVSVFLLVTPWIPPAAGIYGGDVSFLYCTYIIVGIGLLFICGAYYLMWMKVLPRIFNYHYEFDTIQLDDGSVLNHLRRVKND